MSVGSRGSLRVGKLYNFSLHACVSTVLASCTTRAVILFFFSQFTENIFLPKSCYCPCSRCMCFLRTFWPVILWTRGSLRFCVHWWGTQRVQIPFCTTLLVISTLLPFWLLLLAGAAGSPQPKLRSGLLFFVCTVETPLLVCWYWEFGKQPRAELWGGRAPSANLEKNFKCFFSKYQYSACPYTC